MSGSRRERKLEVLFFRLSVNGVVKIIRKWLHNLHSHTHDTLARSICTFYFVWARASSENLQPLHIYSSTISIFKLYNSSTANEKWLWLCAPIVTATFACVFCEYMWSESWINRNYYNFPYIYSVSIVYVCIQRCSALSPNFEANMKPRYVYIWFHALHRSRLQSCNMFSPKQRMKYTYNFCCASFCYC